MLFFEYMTICNFIILTILLFVVLSQENTLDELRNNSDILANNFSKLRKEIKKSKREMNKKKEWNKYDNKIEQ